MQKSKILNQVQDLVRHDYIVILNLALKQVQGLRFQNPILEFDIHLILACLPRAWISCFEFMILLLCIEKEGIFEEDHKPSSVSLPTASRLVGMMVIYLGT
jgi:hypothetical protein